VSELRTLMAGLAFGESPRWHEDRLWFSHWGAGEVVTVDLAGRSEVILRVPSFTFSIDWLPDGRLLVVGGALVLGMQPRGSLVTHADLTGLCHTLNEIVVDGRGNAYINDIGFDLMAGGEFAPGSIALFHPDDSARRVADGVAFPNGMVVTPDNSTLIVAESYAKRLTAFDIAAHGGLSNRRVWADLGDGVPDGTCLDAEGAVWYADVPNKRCARVAEGGEELQTIELDLGCFACMLGGQQRRTLFIVAQEWGGTEAMAESRRTGRVLTAPAPAPGAGWP
jgi:sugar lactone lactonase YvrE